MQSNRSCFTGRQMQHTLRCMPQKSSVDAVLVACVLLIYLCHLVIHSLLIDTKRPFGCGCTLLLLSLRVH